MKKGPYLVVSFILGWACLTMYGQEDPSARMSNLLDARVRSGAIKDATLPQALLAIQPLVDGPVVLFGVELNSDPKHPRLTTSWPDSSLREVLDRFLLLAPGYSYSVSLSNVVHVFPSGALSDPDDLLNLKIRHFKIENGDYRNTITAIRIYAPELLREILVREGQDLSRGYGYMGPGLRAADIPTLSVELTNTTVRKILNQILQESVPVQPHRGIPVGWVYQFEVDKNLPGGGKPVWKVLE